jgi:CubicO group peptidase (beta-lactamase class C family)
MFIVAAALLATQLSADVTAKIDQLFQPYDHTSTPGCSVAVVRNGAIAYSRGYGMADLEHDVAITPATRFDAGSVAKQFTAAAILRLVEQGKLSLDDDVRKYVPEVPDYGTKITLRHLLHHTSGLRDLGDLFVANGYHGQDLVGDREGFLFLSRQKSLNFPPGTEFRYSNTGYWVLSVVVSRVSKQSFRQFVIDNVFAPAGMTDSDIRDDYKHLFHNRAVPYDPAGDGFGMHISNWESPGDTGVITTAEDLAKWTIKGQDLIRRLMKRDPLASGEIPLYAFGLADGARGEHRRIEHGGATSGYRSNVLLLPDDDLAVTVMCNTGGANPTALSDGVADAILGSVPEGQAANVPKHSDGLYVDPASASILRIGTRDGQTTVNGALLHPRSDGRFQIGHFRVVEFHDGTSIDVSDFGARAHRYTLAPPPKPVTQAIAGRYHSDEAGAEWTIAMRDGKVYLSSDRIAEVELKPLYENAFEAAAASWAVFIVEFSDDAFTISDRGIYRLRFTRRGK